MGGIIVCRTRNLARRIAPGKVSRLLEQCVKRATKLGIIERANLKRSAVDEEGRRALNTHRGRLIVFVVDNRNRFVIIDTGVEGSRIETDIGGVLFQIRFGKRADVFTRPHAKQLVVINPELALLVRALGGIRCPMRFANVTLIDYRVIAIGEFDLARSEIIFLELTLRANRKCLAVWSLKIRVLDKINFGVRIAHRSSGRYGGTGTRSDGGGSRRRL